MYTEQEARQKFCPMDQDPDKSPIMCCASACMAWRWYGRPSFVNKDDWMEPSQNCDGAFKRVEQKRGYCGLAGHP